MKQMSKRMKITLAVSLGASVLIIAAGLYFFRDKVFFRADTWPGCATLLGYELDTEGVMACLLKDQPVTPNAALAYKLRSLRITKINRMTLDCSKSKMSIYGLLPNGKEFPLGDVSVNTGSRIVTPANFFNYNLNRQGYKYVLYVNGSLTCVSNMPGCEDHVRYQTTQSAVSYVVIKDADPYAVVKSQMGGLVGIPGAEDPVNSVVLKCMPDPYPNIVGSETTPVGTMMFTAKNNKPKGNMSQMYGVNMGQYIVRFEGSRGLLIHGQQPPALRPATGTGTIKQTHGCIRMYDDQLAALYPYIGIDTVSHKTLTIVP